jgi:heme/copper-type cytochrome/quinol oxidase subunit 2
MTSRLVTRLLCAAAVLTCAGALSWPGGALNVGVVRVFAQEQAPVQRDVTVTTRKYAFDPARIEVNQNDLVRVTLRSDDIAHSFTVDAYRIAKRVGAGQAVTFEFRADQAGTFPVYCNLRQEDGCRNMRGELVVHGK